VAFIVKAAVASGNASWLARATSCPNRSVVGPSGDLEGKGPSANASEEVTLDVSAQVVVTNIDNGSFVNEACGQMSCGDVISEPLGGIWVYLVVVVHRLFGSCVRQPDRHDTADIFKHCGLCGVDHGDQECPKLSELLGGAAKSDIMTATRDIARGS